MYEQNFGFLIWPIFGNSSRKNKSVTVDVSIVEEVGQTSVHELVVWEAGKSFEVLARRVHR